MKIECWSIGKAHDPAIRDAIEDFTSRVNKYNSVKWQILPVPKNAGMLSEMDLKKLEGKMIMEWIEKDSILIALDEYGKEISSEGLANLIVKRGNMGTKKIVFLIGGAFGIDSSVLERADHRIS
jgi:23S rRNA (pseudouridine1915-N3)-methyltransferase